MEEMEIREKVLKLGEAINNHPIIVKYHKLQKQVKNSTFIKKHEEKMITLQKEMVHAKEYNKEEAYKKYLKEYEECKNILDNYPLVIEYREIMAEANDILQLVTTEITEKINKTKEN